MLRVSGLPLRALLAVRLAISAARSFALCNHPSLLCPLASSRIRVSSASSSRPRCSPFDAHSAFPRGLIRLERLRRAHIVHNRGLASRRLSAGARVPSAAARAAVRDRLETDLAKSARFARGSSRFYLITIVARAGNVRGAPGLSMCACGRGEKTFTQHLLETLGRRHL